MEIRKILLIHPPFPKNLEHGTISRFGRNLYPPLGLCYVAATLEKEGYKVKIIDSFAENNSLNKIVQQCVSYQPDIIGITSFTGNFNLSVDLGSRLRKVGFLVVFGGVHPSLKPYESLQRKAADYVVVGEGEPTVVELLDALSKNRDLSTVKGIAYLDGNKIKINQPRKLLENLNILPFPALHLVDLTIYKPSSVTYKNKPVFSVITSRGCPYDCSFCLSKKIWGGICRKWSVQHIIYQIDMLVKKYSAKEIAFVDDNFAVDHKWVEEFCKMLIAKKMTITWSCFTRVDNVNERILRIMKQAGCYRVLFGIESLEQTDLDFLNKMTTLKQIENAMRLTKKVGLETTTHYILGLPNENPQKVKKLVKKISAFRSEFVKFNLMTPYPGTKLYDKIISGKFGKIEDNMDFYDTLFPAFIPNGYTSKKDLMITRDQAYRQYYLRIGYVIQMLGSLRCFDDAKRLFRIARQLFASNTKHKLLAANITS
jgi:radical SAM superfamily enzyme YgiQ (UPF0313 family)